MLMLGLLRWQKQSPTFVCLCLRVGACDLSHVKKRGKKGRGKREVKWKQQTLCILPKAITQIHIQYIHPIVPILANYTRLQFYHYCIQISVCMDACTASTQPLVWRLRMQS